MLRFFPILLDQSSLKLPTEIKLPSEIQIYFKLPIFIKINAYHRHFETNIELKICKVDFLLQNPKRYSISQVELLYVMPNYTKTTLFNNKLKTDVLTQQGITKKNTIKNVNGNGINQLYTLHLLKSAVHIFILFYICLKQQ